MESEECLVVSAAFKAVVASRKRGEVGSIPILSAGLLSADLLSAGLLSAGQQFRGGAP